MRLAYFKSASSDENGRFELQGDDENDYALRVVIDEVTASGDRGATIVCVAMLEECGKDMLVEFCQNGTKKEKFLRQFSAANLGELLFALGSGCIDFRRAA